MKSTSLAPVVCAGAAVMLAGPGVAPAADAEPIGSLDYYGSLDELGIGTGSLEEWGIDFGSLFGDGNQPPPVQNCNASTESGGQGVTETKYILGRPGPADFTLRYETLNQPDEIRVFYQGRLIYNTGYVGDNKNEGTGSARITVPAGYQNFVTVRVTGPEEGTQWEYTVYCPN